MVVQNTHALQQQMDLEDLTMNWMDLDIVVNFDESHRVLVDDDVDCKTQGDDLLPRRLSCSTVVANNNEDDGCEDLPVLSTGPMDLMDFESFLSSPDPHIESDENSSTSFSTTATSESIMI
jgi:hypothetical protein